ncbi:hypothetical protein B4923_17970 [Brenneria roseae subsp. americana]|uniref:Uncharacterized protein n=1 Tax=Brenneria roseae subsp. americana TaxID=1508507 RepID=A0A2U1TKT2_9GAMM|nr:hypothetical protein [Brenneria roseae]PWC10021.1 hypothetical protein B4923_17970 [Brenneria roseae subsp. americana]
MAIKKIITAVKNLYLNLLFQKQQQRRRKVEWLPDRFPDGTVFFDESSNAYFIKRGTRFPELSQAEGKRYQRQLHEGKIPIVTINIDGYFQRLDERNRLIASKNRKKHNSWTGNRHPISSKRFTRIGDSGWNMYIHHHTHGVNPANCLPMANDAFDLMGNRYGTSSLSGGDSDWGMNHTLDINHISGSSFHSSLGLGSGFGSNF